MNQDIIIRILGDRWLRTIVALVMLAVLAQQIALAFWHIYPLPETMEPVQFNPVQQAASDNGPSVNFQQQAAAIGRAYLFGKPEAAPVAAVQVEEAPETRLAYKLRGIYYSLQSSLSSAIIEVRPNDTKVYLVDDELDDNITLARIEVDHVLLNRYGKLERLNLQKPLPANDSSALDARSSPGGGSAQQTALLRSYKKRYSSNPMALATRFQAIPVQQDGKNIGFKLKALRGESLLRRLNFEPDDVFTAVNGVSLRNPFEALDALKSLTTANSVSVTYMRNGAELTQEFSL